MREALQDFYKFTEENRLFVFFATYFFCEMVIVVVKTFFIGTNTILKTYKGVQDPQPVSADKIETK